DEEIEERAAQVLDANVAGGRKKPAIPIDVDTLTECDYRFRVSWEVINDPVGCRTYGALIPERGSELYVARLILNEKYRDFLTEHPEVERFTRGHELCHWIVHVDEGELRSGSLPFEGTEPVRYHRIQYSESSLSIETKNRLAQFAFDDERAYLALKGRWADPEANIEPAWMHRQAEHFSACLLVPREAVLSALENGWDPASYATHSRLAEMFQVSKRVIQIRLKKMGRIDEYEPGRFRNIPALQRLHFGR
ncbi:MAG: ImmA/IrrE family metallo-endopeptidase, partial [Terriglobia bacterium]